jgi:hypothetical protein
MRMKWWVFGLTLFGLIAGPQPARADFFKPTKIPVKDREHVKALAAIIDKNIEAKWKAKGVKPSRLASDAEFLRRVYLDLAGRIPYTSEVRRFLDDKSSDKREQVVERLLNSALYVRHFTNVWRTLMIPENNNQMVQFFAPQFEAWMKDRLRSNMPYDQLARDVLTANVAVNRFIRRNRPVVRGNDKTAIAFYQANEYKAENLASSVSRIFMGVKLECAQCHDHPFAKWTREQFWELASFFNGVMPQQTGRPAPDLKIPGTNKTVKPRFLDDTEPNLKEDQDRRVPLADWLTRKSNPFFARAGANRMWAHFFGIGLIDPEGEETDDNPPSHPKLLDELARQFAEHKYDMKFMIRAITSSRTYQLSSELTHATQNEVRLFARMPVKGMTPEQLFESLVTATGYQDPIPVGQRSFVAFGQRNMRTEFLTKFANQDKRTETHTSILQALALMNGKFIADATSVEDSVTLAGIIDFPLFDTPEKQIEALFLATLNRQPRPAELSKLMVYIKKGGAKKSRKSALADVFWALLNSSEFFLNH